MLQLVPFLEIKLILGALVLCELPQEKYWPYKVDNNYDVEPYAFFHSLVSNYETLKYFCHDSQVAKVPVPAVLDSAKKYLEA